jgi:hypothetical protein
MKENRKKRKRKGNKKIEKGERKERFRNLGEIQEKLGER